MVYNSYRQHTLFMDFLNCLLCDLFKHSPLPPDTTLWPVVSGEYSSLTLLSFKLIPLPQCTFMWILTSCFRKKLQNVPRCLPYKHPVRVPELHDLHVHWKESPRWIGTFPCWVCSIEAVSQEHQLHFETNYQASGADMATHAGLGMLQTEHAATGSAKFHLNYCISGFK